MLWKLPLVPERPVEVSVSARTKIGMGKNVSIIFFTSEGGGSSRGMNIVQ